MRVRVHHTLGDLSADMMNIARTAQRDMASTVRQAGIVGNTVAKDNARRTSGRHGKLYPRSFTWEMSSFHGFGASVFAVQYGPDASRPQGNMEFEWGNHQYGPHLDLNRSADLMGPALAGEVRRLPDKWFW